MRFGSGENELDVRRRLFEGLEEGIKSRVGQHMDFVDDDDPKAALGRPVLDTFSEVTDMIDARMRGAVNLQHIDRAAGGDLEAITTGVAGIWSRATLAVEGFGEQAGGGGFPYTARAGEQKGVSHTAAAEGVTQGAGHMFLTHHFVKGLWPPLTSEDEVTHRLPGALGVEIAG